MTRANQSKVLAVGAAVVFALCLLVLVGVRPADAAFPGKNGKIAFQSNRDVAANEIYTIGANGGTATRITNSNSSKDPAWSPDGTRIAFVSTNNQIFVMNADGSGRRQLTFTSTVKADPAWSPDGTRIAFVANTRDIPDAGLDNEIWVMNTDGSGRKLLTNNPAYDDTQPGWSPRGDKIAFVSSRRDLEDTDRNIYVMDADPATEEAAVNITASGQYNADTIYQGHDDHPTWSPDGKKIAYVHNFTANAGGPPNIWVMNPNGAMASRKNLQNDGDNSGLMPAWSPFGDKIAYVGVAKGTTNQDIHVMNSDGSGQKAIDTGNDTKTDNKPDWQPIPICTMRVNANNDPLIGTAGKDVLCGDSRNNTIKGADGHDIILGQGGNDKLTGGPGNDTLNGGPGKDTVLYAGSTRVIASLETEFARGVGMDVLLGLENLSGSSGNDILTGSASTANALNGLEGNDTLNVRDGTASDKANGGPGTDTCKKDAGDTITGCE